MNKIIKKPIPLPPLAWIYTLYMILKIEDFFSLCFFEMTWSGGIYNPVIITIYI